MGLKGTKTTCSGLDWNVMLGLISQLKQENQWREYLLVSIGCHLGLRASDLLNLKWCDILDKESLKLNEMKTGKEREISIHPRCKANIICAWENQYLSRNKNVNQFIFKNRKGERISLQFINRKLKEVFNRYQISTDNASTHTLRKTFGKRVYELNNKSENSLILLSMVFSHSNVAITRRYLGISQQEIMNVYLNL
ncbi:MAG: tyrosine-type recombinase/integrase [Fluviicola sp.]|nr:tyrosine-type recombinase/integrase [Fluviicola sp.]